MNKELINLLTKDVAFWDNDGGKIAQIPRDDYDQLLVILRTKTEPSKGNKEAIKPLEEALDYKGDYAYDFMCKKIKQTIAILRTDPEQPNCEGCEFFKHTHSNEHCYRYTEARSLCKLRQEPIKQPSAGGFTKELRRKLSDSCCAIIEDLPGWRSMVAEARVMSFEACYRLDAETQRADKMDVLYSECNTERLQSEASREELLTACEIGLNNALGISEVALNLGAEITPSHKKAIEIIKAAIESNKEISGKK